ncbi:helix-turn-helix domain-containing protein [Nocardioides sp. URHA0020]|uniref:helix-turn-helix domain-containing protein n=1 Tax=Nocardioides sp. URHA0020 TaxID=1380392 RepID=UPI0018CBFD2B
MLRRARIPHQRRTSPARQLDRRRRSHQCRSHLTLADDELSLAALAERADLAHPTAHREVARLTSAGIVTERQVRRTRLIRGNPVSPLIAPCGGSSRVRSSWQTPGFLDAVCSSPIVRVMGESSWPSLR